MIKYNLSLLFLLLATILQAETIEPQKREVGSFSSILSSSSVNVIVEQTGKYALEVLAPENYLDNIKTEVVNGELRIFVRGTINYFGNLVVHVQVKELNKVVLTGSGDLEIKGILKAPEFSFRIAGSGDFFAQLNSKIVDGSLNGSGDAKVSGITEKIEIHQSGSGDIVANELHLLSAILKMSGSGDCKFSGSSDSFELNQSGSGDFSGRDFEVETAKIRKTSSGDAQIQVMKLLDINISGSGDLYYSGKADLGNATVTGSGEIVKIK